MKCNVAAFLSAIAVSQVCGFTTKADHSLGRINTTSKKSLTSRAFIPSPSAVSSSAMNMATVAETDVDYDIVKVDLSDDRDYPIYIGAEFDDAEAGKILRSHITGNRALLITNDLLEPMYLEKYENMLKEGGDIQIGKLK